MKKISREKATRIIKIKALKYIFMTCLVINIIGKPGFALSNNSISITQTLDSTGNVSAGEVKINNSYTGDYMIKSEIENQKLIRNIFAMGFIIMMVILLFTMFFYGSKIKKISKIILLQDDVIKSTKDQLIKIINIYNYIDQGVLITDSKGNIEWANKPATNLFVERFEEKRINLSEKFCPENQNIIQSGINEQKIIRFTDNLYPNTPEWKMIPITNSKNEFTNMVFIC